MKKKSLLTWILCFMLGIFTAFIHYPYSQPIAGIGISLLLIIIQRIITENLRPSFLLAVAWPLGYYLISLHWCIFPFLIDDGRYAILAPLAICALSIFLAFFLAMCIYWTQYIIVAQVCDESNKYSKCRYSNVKILISFAVFFGMWEYISAYIIFPFPWIIFGYSSMLDIRYAQGLATFGPHLMTIINIMICGVVYIRSKNYTVWTIFAIIAIYSWGESRIIRYDQIKRNRHNYMVNYSDMEDNFYTNKITVMWLNIFGNTTNTEGRVHFWQNEIDTLSQLQDLMISKAQNIENIDEYDDKIVILPESGIPFYIPDGIKSLQLPFYDRGVFDIISGVDILSSETTSDRRSNYARYNGMILLGKDRNIIAEYRKKILVPFGEYIPFRGILRAIGFGKFVEGVDISSGWRESGSMTRNLEIEDILPFESRICYEGILSDNLFQKNQGNRSLIRINLSNDVWFGRGVGVLQHFAAVRARAIIDGINLLRVANCGVSGYFDAVGREKEKWCAMEDKVGDHDQCRVYAVNILLDDVKLAYSFYREFEENIGFIVYTFAMLVILANALRFMTRIRDR